MTTMRVLGTSKPMLPAEVDRSARTDLIEYVLPPLYSTLELVLPVCVLLHHLFFLCSANVPSQLLIKVVPDQTRAICQCLTVPFIIVCVLQTTQSQCRNKKLLFLEYFRLTVKQYNSDTTVIHQLMRDYLYTVESIELNDSPSFIPISRSCNTT